MFPLRLLTFLLLQEFLQLGLLAILAIPLLPGTPARLTRVLFYSVLKRNANQVQLKEKEGIKKKRQTPF